MFQEAKKPLLNRSGSDYFSSRWVSALLLFGLLLLIGCVNFKQQQAKLSSSESVVGMGESLSKFDLGYESDEFTPQSPGPPSAAAAGSRWAHGVQERISANTQSLEYSGDGMGVTINVSPREAGGSAASPGSSQFSGNRKAPMSAESPPLDLEGGVWPGGGMRGSLGSEGLPSLAVPAIAGSSQAGPSSDRPPTPDLQLMHVEEAGSHDELVAPNSDVRQQPAAASSSARCNDPVNGFEAQIGSCGVYYFHSKDSPKYQSFRLTRNTHQIMYLVPNNLGQCEGAVCTSHDMETCCKLPRKCNPGFLKDVHGGCSGNKVVNPYAGAYCKTVPCTIEDAKMCCISQESELWERTAQLRSNFAREKPEDKSPFSQPRISFGHHDIAWFDMSRKRTVGDTEWAPLVNFMENWKSGIGWQTDAWMKIAAKGSTKYQPLSLKKMFPGGKIPRAIDLAKVKDHH